MGDLGKSFSDLDSLTGGALKVIKIGDVKASHVPYQISKDPDSGTLAIDTDIDGVSVNAGQEVLKRFYNDTGSPIPDGTPLCADGGSHGGYPTVKLFNADNVSEVSQYVGIATSLVPDSAFGMATRFGDVNDVDTSTYSVGPIYAASGGGYTQSVPTYPTEIVQLGSVPVVAVSGKIFSDPRWVRRKSAGKDYGFTSNGIGSGTYSVAGFLDWESTDANLTQALPSQTLGTAGAAKEAHVGITPSGAGSVDAGQVGIKVIGIRDEDGVGQTAGYEAILTTDITTLVAGTAYHTSEKFSGNPSIEFYTVSGSPTTYSLDFNYGFSKYEDFRNRDVTITGFEIVWLGGGNDSGFDVSLKKFSSTNWTYAATGFIAGNGDICRKSVDQALAGNVVNNANASYKRPDLSTFIAGSANEGVFVEVTTGVNNTIQTSDIHIWATTEGLN